MLDQVCVSSLVTNLHLLHLGSHLDQLGMRQLCPFRMVLRIPLRMLSLLDQT